MKSPKETRKLLNYKQVITKTTSLLVGVCLNQTGPIGPTDEKPNRTCQACTFFFV